MISSGEVPGFQVQSIHHALRLMYECFKAANISVAESSPDAPPSPWRLFARPFERILVNQDDDEVVDRIIRRIQRDGQNQIASFQLLHSLQSRVSDKGSSGGGRRERCSSPAFSVTSSVGDRHQRDPAEIEEERETKRAATALRGETAANVEEIDLAAARASAEQRGVGDYLLRSLCLGEPYAPVLWYFVKGNKVPNRFPPRQGAPVSFGRSKKKARACHGP